MTTLVTLLHIVAFGMFIYGLMGLTGPRTAVRGNLIAAVGMGIALVATLLTPGMSNWVLIVIGVVIGTLLGVPSARQVKMTAIPQMVALFNGVGGGAVALIAWVEFRGGDGYLGEPVYFVVASLFSVVTARRARSTARCCSPQWCSRWSSAPAARPSCSSSGYWCWRPCSA